MTGKRPLLNILSLALLISSALPSFANTEKPMFLLQDELVISTDLMPPNTSVGLITEAGAYVEGVLEGAGTPIDLILTGKDGVTRRLLRNVTTQGTFRFVAQDDYYDLRVSGGATNGVKVTILRHLPPSEQLPQSPHLAETTPTSPTLAAILAASDRQQAVQEFWSNTEILGAPLIESDPQGDSSKRLLTFLWRGAQQNARLVGGPTNDHVWMTRLPETDVWFATFRVGTDLRLSYQIAPDVPLLPGSPRERRSALLATLQADPLNKQPYHSKAHDRFEQVSVVELEDAPEQPGLQPVAASQKLEEHDFTSASLSNSRKIWFYTPDGFDAADPDAVLLFVFDGARYIELARTPDALRTLQNNNRLPPVATVFIDNLDSATRWRELSCNPMFLDVLAQDIYPLALSHFGLRDKSIRTAIAGSSLGGLSAACLALRHPDKFGNFISLSGSYWWSPEPNSNPETPYIAQEIRSAAPDLRAFIAAGRYETSRNADDVGILESSHQVWRAMQDGGSDMSIWKTYEGGHDYAVWRGALMDGLIALFGNPAP